MIAKTAPSITSDIVTQETYTDNSEKAESLKALVGQTFSYTQEELFPSISAQGKQVEEV
jgi:hypothetical protein